MAISPEIIRGNKPGEETLVPLCSLNNEALPLITVCIKWIKSSVLVDMCSQSFVSRSLCHSWKRKEVDVLTVAAETLRCCGVGLVQLGVSDGHPIDVEVLVVDGKLPRYNHQVIRWCVCV